MPTFEDKAAERKHGRIILYCDKSQRSDELYRQLTEAGYKVERFPSTSQAPIARHGNHSVRGFIGIQNELF